MLKIENVILISENYSKRYELSEEIKKTIDKPLANFKNIYKSGTLF